MTKLDETTGLPIPEGDHRAVGGSIAADGGKGWTCACGWRGDDDEWDAHVAAAEPDA